MPDYGWRPDRNTGILDAPPAGFSMSNPSPSRARGRIASGGLVFLTVTTVAWGLSWPVTKYLIAQWPPLPLWHALLVGLSPVLWAILSLFFEGVCLC